MTRISKQAERRQRSPKRPKAPSPKTGPKKDALPLGYKEHPNKVETAGVFIPNIT